MAYTAARDVAIGDPTQEADHDELAANDDYLQGLADVDHDFHTSTGTGYHNKEIHLVNGDDNSAATISIDSTGVLRFASVTSSTTPPSASTTVRFQTSTDSAGPGF